MVNKTSTIKRICDSGEAQVFKTDLVCLKRDPEEGVQKCEADVQMQRTPVSLQAHDYDTLSGFSPRRWAELCNSDTPKHADVNFYRAHLRKCVR